MDGIDGCNRWMDKTLLTRRAKISLLKKQVDSKLKGFFVDKIKFYRSVVRTLTKKFRISSSAEFRIIRLPGEKKTTFFTRRKRV